MVQYSKPHLCLPSQGLGQGALLYSIMLHFREHIP
jgi:hypothetical protein